MSVLPNRVLGVWCFLLWTAAQGNLSMTSDRGTEQPAAKETLVVIHTGQSMLRNCTVTPSFSMKHKLAVKTSPKNELTVLTSRNKSACWSEFHCRLFISVVDGSTKEFMNVCDRRGVAASKVSSEINSRPIWPVWQTETREKYYTSFYVTTSVCMDKNVVGFLFFFFCAGGFLYGC